MNRLVVRRQGTGDPVVLVHGSIVGSAESWTRQLPLADRWSLVLVDRPGYGANPQREGPVDFEADGALVADLLDRLGGAHLVGHSYGGLVALFAAAAAVPSVRSLTVVEPPAFGLLAEDPVVEEYVAGFRRLWQDAPREPEAFLRRFLDLVGAAEPPDPLPPALLRGGELLIEERHVWEAEVPIEPLRRASFPRLVVSGGHEPAFELLCDALQAKLDARRAIVPGAGHSVPRTGEPFNRVVDDFLRSASPRYLAASSR